MKKYLEKSMTYEQYLGLIDDLLSQGRTTGENQSEAMFGYGKLNRQRMRRLDKTLILGEAAKEKAGAPGVKWIWLIITEGWCGDAAQNIPIIEKIAAANPGIETRYVLRDENPELMDKYLTFGARSIPKLICLDAETLEEIGTWGPRPQAAMDLFFELKKQEMAKPLMMENIQRWYLQDDNQSLQAEFAGLIEKWSGKGRAANG